MNLPSIPSRKFMRQLLLFIAAMMLALGVATHAESAGKGSNLLTQVQTIRLDSVEGRMEIPFMMFMTRTSPMFVTHSKRPLA
jgi:hypothetical protein